MSALPFSDSLRALLPANNATEGQHRVAFRRIADLLLRHTTWCIAEVPHRFTEVQFYWSGGAHRDPFVHDDATQREFARWYHHRTAGVFRGGSFKGLDVTMGSPDVAAGVFVRGVKCLEGEGALIDGPSLCVDHLLALTRSKSVSALADWFDRRVDAPPSKTSPSYLVVSERAHAVGGRV